MKKHNEGYTLPLVLVVMIVMCLIAVSVMSVALHNLQAQKASITRMQEKYAAQGQLEIQIALLVDRLEKQDTRYNDADGDAGAKSVAESLVGALLDEEDTAVGWSGDENSYHYSVILSAQTDETEIVCEILLKDVIVKHSEGNSSYYEICAPKVVYTSYEIGGAE